MNDKFGPNKRLVPLAAINLDLKQSVVLIPFFL